MQEVGKVLGCTNVNKKQIEAVATLIDGNGTCFSANWVYEVPDICSFATYFDKLRDMILASF